MQRKNKWKEWKQSFEYKYLFRLVFWSELIAGVILLLTFAFDDTYGGDGAWKYIGMREEGFHTIRVEKWFEHKDGYGKTVDYVSCSVTLDETKYTFSERARDVFGEEEIKKEWYGLVQGRLFSSHNRKNFIFSRTDYYAQEIIKRDLNHKFKITLEMGGRWRIYAYVLVFLFLLIAGILKEPGYEGRPDQSKEKQYPEDIRKLAKGLKKGEFRVTAGRAEAIGKYFYGEKEPEKTQADEADFLVDPRAFGNRLMSDTTGKYMAQDIYRMHREPEYDPEEDMETLMEEDPAAMPDEIPDTAYREKLKGPIQAKQAMAKEAILISIDKQPSYDYGKAVVLEYSKYSPFAEKTVLATEICARNMPGNYVLVVRDGNHYGIYEDVLKNQKNPVMCNFDNQMKQLRTDQAKCRVGTWLWAIVSLILLILAGYISMKWMIFPEIVICLLAVRSYPFFIHQMDRKYIKKYGSLAYENLFHNKWGTPYFILYVVLFFVIIIKCVIFGLFP